MEGASVFETVLALMKETGAFGKASAEVRAAVYHLIAQRGEHTRSIPLCRENFVINELIREYLERNGLVHTLSVFVSEAGQPRDPMNREFLSHTLGIPPPANQTPIINVMIRKGDSLAGRPMPVPAPKTPPRPPRTAPVLLAELSDDETDSASGCFEIKA
jgi:lisH domain-containing protein FOPNL